jgi:hypothetical protein
MAPYIAEFSFDRDNDTLTVNGVKFAGLMFYGLATLPEGTWLKLVKREDGVLTLKQIIGEVDYNG